MRSGYADHVFIVTSGESMSIYAAANIGLALQGFSGRGYARMSGIILNRREVPDEENRVSALAAELGTQVVGSLSRSPLVLRAEEEGKCLLQAFPESEMAEEYRRLADAIAAMTLSA
jgi:nitrogenase iron protein NifH